VGAVPAPGGPPPSAAQPPATVSFVPAQVDTIMGGSFNVTMAISNATDLFSAPLQVKYDPKVLKLNDVVQGNLMASDGQQVTFTKNILNDTGEADITLNRLPGNGGVTGSGILVTLSFATIGRGSTSVSTPAFGPTNSQGQPILNASPLLTVNVR
jgi:general secretion pathway protein D